MQISGTVRVKEIEQKFKTSCRIMGRRGHRGVAERFSVWAKYSYITTNRVSVVPVKYVYLVKYAYHCY